MYITFTNNNKKFGGITNNGGSRTVLCSTNELRSLGHRVDVVSHTDKFTWSPHPPVKHQINPSTTHLIAVSISDVADLMKQKLYQKYNCFYWARPFEIDTKTQRWQMKKKKAIKLLIEFQKKGKIITNSSWQNDWLLKHGIQSELCYSGQDLEYRDYKPDYTGEHKLCIGAQYSTKRRKGWSEFKAIMHILGDSCDYVAFGSEKYKGPKLGAYLRNPTRDELIKMYRGIDVFVCCSKLEGFYNPSCEASINGAVLLVNDCKSNGVGDISYSHTCYKYRDVQEVKEIIEGMNLEEMTKKVANCQHLIREKIGDRKTNMQKFVRILEGK